MSKSVAAIAALLALCAALPAHATDPALASPPPPPLSSAGGALLACPWQGPCSPGVAYPLASWQSLFGARHGSGELVGIALKGAQESAIGLGVAHVFIASSGVSAPRTSLALGVAFTMPLSGAGGLRTARPVAFIVFGIGGVK